MNSNNKASGVAVVSEESPTSELKAIDKAGVRGVRFNFLKRLVDFTPRDVLERIAARIAPLGWHIVVYFEMPDLPELESFFTSLPTIVVVDHMGRPDVPRASITRKTSASIRLLDKHTNFWSKVSCPERLTVAGAPYDDVVPFARTLVERFPERVLWGTDWPHPNMPVEAPDDGVLVDVIPKIAPTAALQKALAGRQSDAALLELNAERLAQPLEPFQRAWRSLLSSLGAAALPSASAALYMCGIQLFLRIGRFGRSGSSRSSTGRRA